jgi:hypothetical protein
MFNEIGSFGLLNSKKKGSDTLKKKQYHDIKRF